VRRAALRWPTPVPNVARFTGPATLFAPAAARR
jgi:hypothetical protein